MIRWLSAKWMGNFPEWIIRGLKAKNYSTIIPKGQI
ncbi:unnamed protein product, partial [Onchocerca flexuosa]|uniref:Uncharacterized protein n=1 Tax=Onchocerca flexuosa TaxID=387005 RepID=A0A183HI57_9BILA